MCGLFAVTRKKSSANRESLRDLVIHGMLAQSNRGQDGFAVSALHENKGRQGDFKVDRFLEPVENLEQPAVQDKVQAPIGARQAQGHARYITYGSAGLGNGQPMLSDSNGPRPNRMKSMIFNGNIANADVLRTELEKQGYTFKTDTDTEVLLKLIDSLDNAADGSTDYRKIMRVLEKKIDGGCSINILDDRGDMVGYRFSGGLRPLVYQETPDGLLIVASETAAMDEKKGQIRHVKPGEMIWYRSDDDRVYPHRIVSRWKKFFGLCAFEVLYFQRKESDLFGKKVGAIRADIGALWHEKLSEQFRLLSPEELARIVIAPVPRTAISYTEGLQKKFEQDPQDGKPAFSFNVITPRSDKRAFLTEEEERDQVLSDKHAVDADQVKNKIVYLMDDTLVRGDTIQSVSKKMWDAGAKEVRWLICSPLVIGSDYYGMSLPTVDELAFWQAYGELTAEQRNSFEPGSAEACRIVGEHIAQKLQRELGGKMKISIQFLDVDSLQRAIPGKVNMSGFTGEYPTRRGQRNYDESVEQLKAGLH